MSLDVEFRMFKPWKLLSQGINGKFQVHGSCIYRNCHRDIVFKNRFMSERPDEVDPLLGATSSRAPP